MTACWRRVWRLPGIVVITVILALGCVGGVYAADPPPLLVLHSYHPGLSWERSIQHGIEDTLEEEGFPVDMHIEFMDTKRFSGQRHYDTLLTLLRNKYSNKRFAAVICTDNNAFEFLRAYSGELFPETPIVFCGVNDFDPASIAELPQFTGTAEAIAMGGTVETILRVQPSVRRIILLGSDTSSWQKTRQLFVRLAENGRFDVDLELRGGLDMPAIFELLRPLGEGDAVIIGSTYRDRSGSMLDFEESTSAISDASPVPTYGLWDFQLGSGIVGGKLISGYEQGVTAAHLALKVLSGTPASEVNVVLESPNLDMFDNVQLVRRQINPDLLPEESVVINKPPSFYQENRPLVWSVAAILVALAVVIITLVLHILSRRRVQKQLVRSERNYRSIFNATNDAILIHDAQTGAFLDANAAAQAMFSLPRDQKLVFSAPECSDVEGGYDNDRAKELLRKANEEGPQLVEWRSRSKQGGYFWTEIGLQYAEINGEPRILVVVRDIDDRKSAQENVRSILQMLPVAVAVYDAERILYVNRKYTETFGWALEDLPDLDDWWENAYPDAAYRAEVRSDWASVVEHAGTRRGDSEMREYITRTADGEDRCIEYRYWPLHDRGIVVMVDVTERNALMQRFEEKNAELERFTYTVSHDLKSPIITIKGFSGMLRSDIHRGDLQRALDDMDRIDSAADKMTALLDELLELSRVGRLITDLEQLSVSEVAEEAVELVSGVFDECGGSVQVQPDMPEVVCERVRLREVFQNLLENATKFRTPDVPLEVTIGATQGEDGVIYHVSDNGIGIQPRYQEKVFDIFEQLDAGRQGTGIGLALVRRIIHYHGGQVWVESQGQGKGCSFCFTLDRPQSI